MRLLAEEVLPHFEERPQGARELRVAAKA